MADTQRTADEAGRLEMVWWIPTDFWRVSMLSNPSTSPAMIDEIEKALSPYTLFFVASGQVGPLGGVTWTSNEVVTAELVLRDVGGGEHRSLPPDQIGADAKTLAAVVKPLLANIMGPMGENMHMLFFPAKTRTGETIANPRADGAFSVQFRGAMYRWRLPLGSFLPPKMCPVDNESMDGAWTFCPWHGKELTTRQ